ncbi:MAG: CHAT domain-containing protein [Oscillatoriales cyanobacterium C42_A2020_001]|nr:CHAT domain-containing protein [Leptolyngbyaceae cyanobacterium C42_A2020_001]
MRKPLLYKKQKSNDFQNLVLPSTVGVIGLSVALCCVVLGDAEGVAQISTPTGVSPSSSRSSPSNLLQQGRDFYQQGQFTQAKTAWQQAVSAFQQQGDRANQALALSYLSLAHQQLSEWQSAQDTISTSLTLLNSPSPIPNSLLLAQVLNTLGSLQYAQGQTETALATWQRAYALYANTGDESRQIGNLINQAQAQQALGLFLRAQRSLTEVERLLQQQADPALKALGLRSLGNTLLLLGDSAAAQRVLQQSLVLIEHSSSIASQEKSAILLSLGNAARAQNDTTTALRWYQQAATNSAPVLRSQAQVNHLNLLLTSGQTTAAQALIPTLQAQLSSLPPSRAAIYAQIYFAQTLLFAATPRQPAPHALIAQTLATAVQHAERLNDLRAKSYAIGYLGGVYERTGQWSQAHRLTEQALLLAQSINAPDIAYQWQWQLGRILKAEGQTAAALRAYEAAYTTLQSIRGNLVATSTDLQFSFRESVEPVYREFVDLLLQTAGSSPDAGIDGREPSKQARLEQARVIIEALRVAELDNFFRTACLEGQTIPLDAVQQTDAAVIYPIILRDRLEVILKLPNQPLRRYSTNVPQVELETTISEFRSTLEKPFTTPESRQLGQRLYNWLIAPLQPDLEQHSIKTLAFVLDGSLRSIPIAALRHQDQYLIERYSIALSPSLRLLNPQPLQQRGFNTLAAGLTEERHGFSALSFVNSELKEIQSEVASRVLLNQTFTTAELQAQMNKLPYPIVHLATHGQFSSNAEETFILAWDRPIKVNELSTLLKQREDSESIPIELLVLSACETAQGDQRAALGLAGVAVQAGARSTLATLWSIDDESSSRFAGQFYAQLAKGNLSKAEALRQAQLSLLHDPQFRHPRYWAPYVLLGNWL